MIILFPVPDMWPGDSGSSIKKSSVNHDRPEKSVTLRLYTMQVRHVIILYPMMLIILFPLQKHHFMISFTIFFILFFISVLLGVMSPSMVHTTQVRATQIQKNASSDVRIPRGPFVLKSPRLSRYNQQLWLSVMFNIANNVSSHWLII